jgi:hypothetical protein
VQFLALLENTDSSVHLFSMGALKNVEIGVQILAVLVAEAFQFAS